MRTPQLTILAFGLFSFIFAGCGDSSSTAPSGENETEGSQETATPTITITSPEDGEEVTAVLDVATIELSYETSDGRDDDAVDCLLDGTSRGLGSDGNCQFTNVSIGTHTVGVAVLQSDGTPYENDEANASIEIKVVGVACGENADCEDGDPCTLTVCEGGTCAYYAAPVPIEDCNTGLENFICKEDADCSVFTDGLGSCSTAFCDSDQKVCVVNTIENGETCDDGDTCTVGDSCVEGDCVGGGPADCDDGDMCTTEECVAGEGCVYVDEVCDDSDDCTIDSCDPAIGCIFEANAAGCDDGDICTTDDSCTDGVCAGTLIECEDGDFCTPEICDPETGECIGDPEVDIIECFDDNVCTVDACAEDGGCSFTPDNGALCDDGDLCTVEDGCQDGSCISGALLSCDDGDACTFDGNCDVSTGTCSASVPINCDDGDPCTLNSCNANGVCETEAIPNCCVTNDDCDDKDPCNGIESCEAGFCATGTPLTCGDGLTSEECGEQCDDGNQDGNDGCSAVCAIEESECGTSQDCNDGNPCTDDICSTSEDGLGGECIYTNNAGFCDDGNACTTAGTCSEGVCVTETLECNDGIDCTVDSCEPDVGCINTADNSLCTADECKVGVCSESEGCSQVADVDGGACEGDACTENGLCQTGLCIGDAVDCEDGDVCTGIDCNATIGCTYLPETNKVCNDGDACTEADKCTAGGCVGTAISGCGEEGVVCSLSGASGLEVSCFLGIARSEMGTVADPEPNALGLQFKMLFDPAKMTLINFYDEIEFMGITAEVYLTGPGKQTLSSGHTLAAAPPNTVDWNQLGEGFAAFSNFSDTTAAFTDAYMDGDTPQGDALFVEARFTLETTVAPGNPAEVILEDVEAFYDFGQDMTETFSGNIIVTTPEP